MLILLQLHGHSPGIDYNLLVFVKMDKYLKICVSKMLTLETS